MPASPSSRRQAYATSSGSLNCRDNTPVVPRPLVIKPVQDPARPFSYCVKPFCERRVSYTGADGKRRLRHLALKSPQLRELALFGAAIRANKLQLLYGIGRCGRELRVVEK